jgi:hypothetical protein
MYQQVQEPHAIISFPQYFVKNRSHSSARNMSSSPLILLEQKHSNIYP